MPTSARRSGAAQATKTADEGIRPYKGKNRREQRNAHPQFVGAALAAARREPPYHEECEADT